MIGEKRKKIRRNNWGVAGCGRFAENAFLPALQMLKKNEVISLFSNNKERADELSKKFGIPNAFSNYNEFLNSNINCVYISSANSNHYEQVIKAAKAGKNILCEKPLALSSSQAEEMVKVCEDNGVRLAVSYVYKFHPLVRKAKELINSEYIGKLVSINLNFNIDMVPGNNFRFNKDLSGGGALRDLGTHMIDLLRFLGGEIESIQGAVDNVVYKSDVDDFAAAIVRFENGGYGYFNVSYNNKKAFNRVEILGSKGAMSIEKLTGNQTAKLTILREGETKKSFRKRANKLFYLLKSVQQSFLKNEQPLATGTDGLINMKIMEELESKCLTKRN
jgi:D-xylose 1-dehydrogenase (NADP+, D-xylono-1,5-lactone-forming)